MHKIFFTISILYLIFLTACSDARPSITRLESYPGPRPSLGAQSPWSLEVPYDDAVFQIQGVCSRVDTEIQYSWDGGSSWVVVNPESDGFTDVNCSDETFSFLVSNPQIDTTLFLRTKTTGDWYSDLSSIFITMTY